MTATTDTPLYGTVSIAENYHYGGDLKYGAWAVLPTRRNDENETLNDYNPLVGD